MIGEWKHIPHPPILRRFSERAEMTESTAYPKIDPQTDSTDVRARSGADALLRLSDVLAPDGPIPVSKSTWWQGVKDGRFPAPVKLGPRTTAWRASEIAALVERGVA